jgi:hypothetical protein
MNSRDRKKLTLILHRISFLERKMETWRGTRSGSAWNRVAAERAALEWAVSIIYAWDAEHSA